MDPRERELRQQITELKNAAEQLMNEGKQEEARAKIEEAKQVKSQLDNHLEMQDLTLAEPKNTTKIVKEGVDEMAVNYTDVFLKALRKKSLNEEEMSVLQEFKAAMVEGTGQDGGFIVPQDITTKINELKRTIDDLEQYVTVEPVNTNTGSRVLEKDADHTPFADLSEMGSPNALQDMGNPQFVTVPYSIKDRGGFMPISNNLLSDTDQNLMGYIAKWIAKKARATRNSLILAALNTLTKVAFADYDDIKKALNVTLDPAIAQSAMILTNQDGFNYLDELKDADNRPLLQPDPTSPTNKLFAGRRVVVLSNKTLASVPGTGNVAYPFLVGDLKEAVVLFDRQQYSIDITKEGGNAWRTNSTELRAIEREDVKLWDSTAVVYGQITVTV